MELQILKEFEKREAFLESISKKYKHSKNSSNNKIYDLKCKEKLLSWKIADRTSKSECSKLQMGYFLWGQWDGSIEDFEEAERQKFANRIWICEGEREITEYLFKMEWLLGLWSPEKVSIALVDVESDSTEKTKTELGLTIAQLLELDYEKDRAAIQDILDNVPTVLLENVELRKANKIKQTLECFDGVTVTLAPVEEFIDEEKTETEGIDWTV